MSSAIVKYSQKHRVGISCVAALTLWKGRSAVRFIRFVIKIIYHHKVGLMINIYKGSILGKLMFYIYKIRARGDDRRLIGYLRNAKKVLVYAPDDVEKIDFSASEIKCRLYYPEKASDRPLHLRPCYFYIHGQQFFSFLFFLFFLLFQK